MRNIIPIFCVILWVLIMASIPISFYYYGNYTECGSYEYNRLKMYYADYPEEMEPLIDKALEDNILRKWESDQIYQLKERLDQTKEKRACLEWWKDKRREILETV